MKRTSTWSLSKVTAAGFLVCAVSAFAQAAQPAAKSGAEAVPVPPLMAQRGAPPAVTSALDEWLPEHTAWLRADGNLAGRVCVLDSLGSLRPTRAKVSFVQGGQVIASVRTDELGRFQVVGLLAKSQERAGSFQVPGVHPGVYSVIASGPEGVAAFGVRVVSFDENAPTGHRVLNIALIPVTDTELLTKQTAPVGPVPPVYTPEAAGVMSGGGGAGGGGLGALLGLAGLGAGLGAGGGGDVSVGPITSRFQP